MKMQYNWMNGNQEAIWPSDAVNWNDVHDDVIPLIISRYKGPKLLKNKPINKYGTEIIPKKISNGFDK